MLVSYRTLARGSRRLYLRVLPADNVRKKTDNFGCAARAASVLRSQAPTVSWVHSLTGLRLSLRKGANMPKWQCRRQEPPAPQRTLRTLSRLRSAAKDALEQHTERVQTGAGPGAPSPAPGTQQTAAGGLDSAAEFFASPEAGRPKSRPHSTRWRRGSAPSRPEAAFRVLTGIGTGCLAALRQRCDRWS